MRDIVVQVSTELVDIYSQMAAHYENKEDEESSNLALQYLENCLEVIDFDMGWVSKEK